MLTDLTTMSESSEPRLSVCLTFDWDTMSIWPTARGLTDRLSMSRGEFGAFCAPRLFELLARHDVKGSFYTPGFTALAYPELVRRAADEGHEIGHHGWMHENPASLDAAEERRVIELGLEALQRVTGQTPSGYRLPGTDFGAGVVDVLLEYGFMYEGTSSASDFFPCYLRNGDRWSPVDPYVFGEVTELVGMPFNWALCDVPYFEFVPGWSNPLMPLSGVREIWQGEFDYAYEHCPGGVYVLALHPETIGRGSRLDMLEDYLEYMKGKPGVRFIRMDEYVTRWQAANPVAQWTAENPILAGTSAMVKL
jgi:peptidoglycan/xylan/chitin deacetylase (PgdA/CDA1 family)